MATGESRDDDGGIDESPPEPPKAGFFARMLWGVDAPTTDAESERRWARAGRDLRAIYWALVH